MNLFIRLLGSGIVVQVLTILTTLIFSRVFSVNQFGELALYASFGSLMAVIAGFRFDYLILKNDVDNKGAGFLLSNLISLFVNILVISVVFVLKSLFNLMENINILYLASFGLGYSFFNNFSQYLIALKKYNNFIYLRFFQVFGILILGMFFNYAFFSNEALLYAYSFSQLIFGLFGFAMVVFNNIAIRELIYFFKENYVEAVKNFLISFMQYSTPLVPVLVGGYIFDQKNIGAYFVFSQMISAPLNIFRRNLLVFFNGEFGEREKFYTFISKKFFSKANLSIFLLVLAFSGVVVYIFQKEIVSIILGLQWVEYSYLLFPLVIYFLFDCIFQPFTTLLPLWGKVNYSLLLEAFRFCLLVVVLPMLTINCNLDFLQFLLVYIGIMLGVYILIFFRVIQLSKFKESCAV